METSSREAGERLAPKCPEKNQEELETVGGDEGHKIKSQTKCSKRTFGIEVKAVKSVWKRWDKWIFKYILNENSESTCAKGK